jgi:hypothetical protein
MSKVVKKEQQNLVVQPEGFELDSGQGFENVTSEDLLTPYLTMLQKGSPQVDVDSPERIEGATAGMFYNNVTKELFNKDGKGLHIIPAFFEKVYVEWVERSKGGGLKGWHKPESDIVINAIVKNNNSKIGKLVTPSETILMESYRFFVIAVDFETGVFFPAIMSFASTQIKAAKGWISKSEAMKLRNAKGEIYSPAAFSRLWKFTSITQQNESGIWRGWKIDFDRYISLEDPFERSLYGIAKKFHEHAKQGIVKSAEEPKAVVEESEAEF